MASDAPTRVIDDLRELQALLSDIGSTDRVACRGQAAGPASGSILSSLDRTLRDDLPYELRQHIERLIVQRFRQHAPAHLPVVELMHLDDGPSLLMLMRHYGTPTRLVDWTESIWIAAYFAAFGAWQSEGVIWVFDRLSLDEQVEANIGDAVKEASASHTETHMPLVLYRDLGPWVCRLFPTGPKITRIIAQQGFFTIAGRLGIDHWHAIGEILPDEAAVLKRRIIRIAPSLKPQLLKELDRMGINGSTLFPGIDGVGRSLSEFAHYAAIDKAVLATASRVGDQVE